jgi:hypothetical protein
MSLAMAVAGKQHHRLRVLLYVGNNLIMLVKSIADVADENILSQYVP